MGLHIGVVVPAVPGVVGEVVGLAHPVGMPPLGGDQVLGRDAAGVAQGQGRPHHRGEHAAPDLDHREASPQQRFRLVRQQVPHPLRSGPLGVVVVDPPDRTPDSLFLLGLLAPGTQGVVEDQHPRGPGGLPDQRLHLGIVHGAQLVLVVEVGHPGGLGPQHESLALHGDVRDLPGVPHRRPPGLVLARVPGLQETGPAGVGHGFRPGVDQVVETRFDDVFEVFGCGCGHGVLRLFRPSGPLRGRSRTRPR